MVDLYGMLTPSAQGTEVLRGCPIINESKLYTNRIRAVATS